MKISAGRVGIAAFALCFPSLHTVAQTAASAHYDAATKVFRLDAAGVSYAMGLNENNQLQSIYWGRRLAGNDPLGPAHAMNGIAHDGSVTVTPQEFTGWGGGLYVEPDLKVTFPDGNRDLVLKYVSHNIQGALLDVVTRDISRDVFVTLHYAMDADTGILKRWATIENRTAVPFTMEQVGAGTWNLPRGTDYRLRYYTGRWASEWHVQEQPIHGGKTMLESRRGTTGFQNNPWFAIDHQKDGDQDEGSVWFGALAWSGSWQIAVEQDILNQVRVTGGLDAFDFSYPLKPGKRFDTPAFYGGYSAAGIGGASRLMHRLEVDSILPHAPHPKLRPVLYNSWEATEFAVTEQGQMDLATKAATIGTERFVMDDGWFGERKDDHAGLGDWYVNTTKFPHGLKPLIDHVHSLGMDFGLWVEPEMVNANSDLYRTHPDWVLNFPGRPRTEGRNQMVLNLARPDVRAYIFGFVDKLLSENDIAFIKWDYNRNWSEPGWDAMPLDEQKKVYVEFTRNYYSILEELRRKHPNVEFESCSSGGGRVDLGVLRYADEVWPSDNTDAFDRLTIQDGFTYAFTPAIMMAWVTDVPSSINHRTTSLEYRFLSSMQGSLAVGADLKKWAPEDFAAAKRLIGEYKSVRETVQRGSLYRLVAPTGGSDQSITEYVARDGHQAVAFPMLHSSSENYPYPTVHFRGLDEHAMYKLSAMEGKPAAHTPAAASGAYWMGHGVDVALKGDFQGMMLVLEKQ